MQRNEADKDLRVNSARASDASLTPRTIERRRLRASLVQESPRTRVRRVLVLIGRFNAMATPGSDPARLIEPLRGILTLACEVFEEAAMLQSGEQIAVAMSTEQVECLRNLEMLSKGLPQGSPDAWRELRHATDTLLVQCVLLDCALSAPAPGPAARVQSL